MAEIVTLEEGVAELVSDGDTVALEGFTHLIPHAAGHELIRQGRRELTLIRMTPDVVCDQLIGMDCARKLHFSWGGNPGVGSLHRFRDAAAAGDAVDEADRERLPRRADGVAVAVLPLARMRVDVRVAAPVVVVNVQVVGAAAPADE